MKVLKSATLGQQLKLRKMELSHSTPATGANIKVDIPQKSGPSRLDMPLQKPALFGCASAKAVKLLKPNKQKHLHLKGYLQGTLGIDHSLDSTVQTGKQPVLDCDPPLSISDHVGVAPATLPFTSWKDSLPTPVDLYKQEFGKPDSSHSFTQEACADTCMHFVLKSDFLTPEDKALLVEETNPLIAHLDKTRVLLANYDFTWIRNMDTNWSI